MNIKERALEFIGYAGIACFAALVIAAVIVL